MATGKEKYKKPNDIADCANGGFIFGNTKPNIA